MPQFGVSDKSENAVDVTGGGRNSAIRKMGWKTHRCDINMELPGDSLLTPS
jgi:hypothetical protein